MEIIRSLQDCDPIPDGVITVGTFDGIHLAHTTIIQRVLKLAHELGVTSTVVTFDPHPRTIVKKSNNNPVWLLTTTEEKISLLKKFNLDRLVIIPFTKKFSQTPPDIFITEVLCKKIGMQKLIIGYDHGFGKDRSGDSDFLRNFEKEYNFEMSIQEPVSNRYGIIASAHIRNLIIQGDVSKVPEYLGRHYKFSGTVVPGDGRGKEINFPTANILVDNPNKCIPANGVYIVRVDIDGTAYNGAMNIGIRPTFQKKSLSLEVHLLDFYGDLYNKSISITFLEKIRGEMKFDSPELLRRQISSDVEFTRTFLQQTTVDKAGKE